MEINKLKISNILATDEYLKISNNEYADFLIEMPIHTINEGGNNLSNGEYEPVETFNSFRFAGKIYDLYIKSGRTSIGNHTFYSIELKQTGGAKAPPA